jgi:hypothetical protein
MFLGLEREDCFPVVFPTANRISGPAGGCYKDVPSPIETAHDYTARRQQDGK